MSDVPPAATAPQSDETARAAPIAPALAPLAVLLATGLAGVDFGWHWDELDSQIEPARQMLVRGDLLPHVYVYPGVARWLCLLPAFFYGLPRAFELGLGKAMLEAIARPDYLLSVRAVFIVLTAFATYCVYLAIFAYRRSVLEALLGACLLGFSFEYAYHARWATTDCVMATFVAVTLMSAAQYRQAPEQRRWLWVAAASAGLALGTKYPGGIVLLLVLVAAWQGFARAPGPRRARRLLGTGAAIAALFWGAFLVSTPGVVLDFAKFKEDLLWQIAVYQTGWGPYTIEPGWEHLKHATQYFALAWFSHFKPIAVSLFAAAVIGAISLLRRRCWADAAFLLPVPVLYFLYFSTQKVMIVRNLQLLGVFAALFAARGLTGLWSWARAHVDLPPRPLLVGAGAVVALMLLANATWLAVAAQSIRVRRTREFGPPAVEWMARHPEHKFSLSPNLRAGLVGAGLTLPPNVVADRAAATHIGQFAKIDHSLGAGWLANDPWMTAAAFGPFELNFDYYPTWYGDDRIVFVAIGDANRLGLALP